MKTVEFVMKIVLKNDDDIDWIYNTIEEQLETGEQITEFNPLNEVTA